MDLFGEHLLDAATHQRVFGELPSSVSRALRTAEVGDLVTQLLDAGWRPGQIGARVGAMTAGDDAVADVTRLLTGFLDQLPPDARWRQEKSERDLERSRAEVEQPASDETRREWIARIRSELAIPRERQTVTPIRQRPACAMCGEDSIYYVTRDVRMCDACVAVLGSGGAPRLGEAG
jgi:hypothetical protein